MKSAETYHFYRPDGSPCHGTIEAGLKAGAHPSVTTVLSIIRKEFVEKWKIREAVGATFLIPRDEGEALKDYANRCMAYNERMQNLTTDFGTQVHQNIENFHLLHMAYQKDKANIAPPTAEISCEDGPKDGTLPWIKHYVKWFYKNVSEVIAAESNSVSNELGYAGQIDAIVILKNGKTAILDFKTQKFKEKRPWGQKPRPNPKLLLPDSCAGKEEVQYWPPGFYETWLLQLCAYRHSLNEQTNLLVENLVSVTINSQEPAPMHSKTWAPEDYEPAFKIFINTLHLWKWTNNYQTKGPK